MSKKRIFLAVGTLLGISSLLIAVNTDAASIIFRGFMSWDPISSAYSMVHFSFPQGQNDYQGWIFWLPSTEKEETLSYGGQSRTCSKQVRGLYYNEQRWQRLWPMDTASLNYLRQINSYYDSLGYAGWLFTTCTWGNYVNDTMSIYGQITYTDQLLPTNYQKSTLSAWFLYNVNNKISQLGFFPTLAYFNNETPLGYIYDSISGVGFVGGKFTAHDDIINDINNGSGINEVFSIWDWRRSCYHDNLNICVNSNIDAWMDTAWQLTILWNTLFSRWWLTQTDRKSILGNISKTSAVIFSDIINTADILNPLRRNSNNLCRGKTWYDSASAPVLSSSEFAWLNIICIANQLQSDEYNPDSDPLVIRLRNTSDYVGKDIIVRGRDVILEGSMPDTESELNIFVDKWNIFLKPTNTGYRSFDMNWAPKSPLATKPLPTASTWFAYGHYIKGNILINGLIAWWTGTMTEPEPGGLPIKYYVYGKIGTLNTALDPSLWRENMVLNTLTIAEANPLMDSINLTNVFTWQCGIWLTQTGSDNIPCQLANDRFKNASFVLINQRIETHILQ